MPGPSSGRPAAPKEHASPHPIAPSSVKRHAARTTADAERSSNSAVPSTSPGNGAYVVDDSATAAVALANGHAERFPEEADALLSSDISNDELEPGSSGLKAVPPAAEALASTPPASTSTPMMSSETWGLLLVLCSTFFFSLNALCSHFLGLSYPSFQIASMRYGISCVLGVLAIVVFRWPKLRSTSTWLGEPQHTRLLVIRSLLGVCGMSSYLYSLGHMDLSDAATLAFLNVPLTGVLAAVLLKEGYSVIDGVCALASMAGVVLVAQPPALFGGEAESSIETFPLLVALFGAVTSSFAYITVRQLGITADALVVTLYFSMVGGVLAPLALIEFQTPLPIESWEDRGMFAAIGFLGFAGQQLLNRGLQRAPARLATVMRYTDIVFAVLWQATLLGSPPGPLKLGGCALVMSGIVAVVAKQRPWSRASASVTAAKDGAVPASSPVPAEEGAPPPPGGAHGGAGHGSGAAETASAAVRVLESPDSDLEFDGFDAAKGGGGHLAAAAGLNDSDDEDELGSPAVRAAEARAVGASGRPRARSSAAGTPRGLGRLPAVPTARRDDSTVVVVNR